MQKKKKKKSQVAPAEVSHRFGLHWTSLARAQGQVSHEPGVRACAPAARRAPTELPSWGHGTNPEPPAPGERAREPGCSSAAARAAASARQQSCYCCRRRATAAHTFALSKRGTERSILIANIYRLNKSFHFGPAPAGLFCCWADDRSAEHRVFSHI